MAAHFLEGKHIVVAGAGLSGLAFTIALRKQWPRDRKPPRVTIYDRDDKETAAGRIGYSLSVAGYDETGGLVALKDLGLLDKILEQAILGVDDKGSFKIWNANWGEVMSVRAKPAAGLPTAGIRIARQKLRQTLIDAVAATDEIRWGNACMAAEIVDGSRVRVQLADNSTVECDVLVAADGASSKLRTSLRPADELRYAGAMMLGGNAVFPQGIPKPVDENWGLQLSGQGVACFYSPVDEKTVVWSLSLLEPEPRAPAFDRDSPEQFRALMDEARRRGGGVFGELFGTMVDATEQSTALCIAARDKPAFAHGRDGGPVVFIGDSNHAVSPFAGYGASLAMKDGWDLAEKLCRSGSLGEAVAAYDAISVPRAEKILKSSRWRIAMAHSTGRKFLGFKALLTVGGFMLWLMGRS